MGLVLELSELDPLSSVLTIIAGLLLLLAGKLIVKTITSLVFGAGASYLTYKIMCSLNISTLTVLLISSLVFIIGYFISWFLIKLFISISSGFAVGAVIIHLLNIQNIILYALIVIVVCIVICYFLAEVAISIASTILGLVMLWIGFENLFHKPMLTVIIVFAILALTLYYKIKSRR